MGTWGHSFDQNDDAGEFLDGITDTRDWSRVETRISSFLQDGAYAEAQDTVAALELVAAALGRPNADLDPDLASWAVANRQRAETVRATAAEAADLVQTKSELSELWGESVVDPNERSGWHAAMDDLRARLATD